MAQKYFTSIIIPIFNQLSYTKLCVDSMYSFADEDLFELIIIDNASTDGSVEYLEGLGKSNLRVVRFTENKGVAPAWNEGIKQARGNIFGILNNDLILTPGWLDKILKAFDNPNVWCASPLYTRLDLEDNFSQLAADVDKNEPRYLPINHIAGFCFFVKKEAMLQLGLFDEQFEMGWFEDTDFNMKLHSSGHPPVQVENVLIHHFESRTIVHTPEFFEIYPDANAKKFAKKWDLKNLPSGKDLASPQYIDRLKAVQYPVDFDINDLKK